MLRLLIVDDEQEIADGLFELLQVDYNYEELELYKCYSAADAVKLIENTKIDILLTDIHMPEFSGLQLVEYVSNHWKSCQIIFLTGYDHFEYVYKAIQFEHAQYLLKSEPDHVIFNAINKAVDMSLDELHQQNLLDHIKKHIDTSLPILQKNFFASLLTCETEERTLSAKLSQFQINLDHKKETLAFLAKFISTDTQNTGQHLKNELQNEVYMKTFLEQHFSENINFYVHTIDSNTLLCIVQEKANISNLFALIKGELESIQTRYLNLFDSSAKLIITRDFFNLSSLSVVYKSLCRLYYSSFHHNDGEFLILETQDMLSEFHAKNGISLQNLPFPSSQIQIYLDNFNMPKLTEFFDILQGFQASENDRLAITEVILSISYEFIKYINKYNLNEVISQKMDLSPLTNLHNCLDIRFTTTFLNNLTICIFTIKEQSQDEQNHNLINFLIDYIDKNLNGDLSLSTLSDKVFLNSFYLSRQFKSFTGINLSDYITQKRMDIACKLIKNTSMKIINIATEVGYDTATYFNRVFKKQFGITPNEYRTQLQL